MGLVHTAGAVRRHHVCVFVYRVDILEDLSSNNALCHAQYRREQIDTNAISDIMRDCTIHMACGGLTTSVMYISTPYHIMAGMIPRARGPTSWRSKGLTCKGGTLRVATARVDGGSSPTETSAN